MLRRYRSIGRGPSLYTAPSAELAQLAKTAPRRFRAIVASNRAHVDVVLPPEALDRSAFARSMPLLLEHGAGVGGAIGSVKLRGWAGPIGPGRIQVLRADIELMRRLADPFADRIAARYAAGYPPAFSIGATKVATRRATASEAKEIRARGLEESLGKELLIATRWSLSEISVVAVPGDRVCVADDIKAPNTATNTVRASARPSEPRRLTGRQYFSTGYVDDAR